MRKKIITAVFLLLAFGSVNLLSAQSILQQYYAGDSVKMHTDAMNMINSADPVFKSTPSEIKTDGDDEQAGFIKTHKVPRRNFVMRDGKKINAYTLASTSGSVILFIHGVNSNAAKYLKTAWLLQKATGSTIYAVDLRGHGLSAGTAGDVDHVNQYADDIADMIGTIRKEKPRAKILLAGHSMGGGVILKYVSGKYRQQVNGYVLMAPLLGHNSPAIKLDQGGVTNAPEPTMQLNFQRIIGLKMLNELGIHQNDSLPVMFFNQPNGTPVTKYTYRANMSMAPENFIDGLGSVDAPLLVVIGEKDEVFDATAQQKAVQENSKGKVVVVKDAKHDNLCLKKETFDAIKNWMKK